VFLACSSAVLMCFGKVSACFCSLVSPVPLVFLGFWMEPVKHMVKSLVPLNVKDVASEAYCVPGVF
jgi:hypothetical protein